MTRSRSTTRKSPGTPTTPRAVRQQHHFYFSRDDNASIRYPSREFELRIVSSFSVLTSEVAVCVLDANATQNPTARAD